LAKSLDKGRTFHPGWEGFIKVNMVHFFCFRLEELKATLFWLGHEEIKDTSQTATKH